MHSPRLCTATVLSYIRIGPAVKEELRLQDIWTDRRTGRILFHAHPEVVYCNCLKFKVSSESVQPLRRSCAYDIWTDRQTDRAIPIYPPPNQKKNLVCGGYNKVCVMVGNGLYTYLPILLSICVNRSVLTQDERKYYHLVNLLSICSP